MYADSMTLERPRTAAAVSNARYELLVSMLDASTELRAFCRSKGIKVFHDMMHIRFVGLYHNMEELITTQLAAANESKARLLTTSLSRTF